MNEDAANPDSIQWVKAHAREIVNKFAVPYPSAQERAVSVFMAGSPGAGKTEFSTRLIEILEKKEHRVVRIDPDEIRMWFPFYVPGKAEMVQSAVGLAVEKIHDYALQHNQHFLLDGTSSKLDKLQSNIRRSLEKDRVVIIQYVYQDAVVAWDFTQKREAIDGRNIPKDVFIEQLFSAYENVEKVKQEFGDRIEIDFIQSNIQTKEYVVEFNVRSIAEHLTLPYSKSDLQTRL